jgi:hypothetical protein
MKHSTTTPTIAEARRFRKLREFGCVACYLDGNTRDSVEPEIHHFLSGNKRIGHSATVPLCTWHHVGIAYDGVPPAWFLENVGPSFHKHTRAFRQRYGSDAELLATVNELIGSDQ